MTRVLMTGDTVGGVWTYALTLAKGLSRHGVEVHLATMGGLPTAGQRARALRIEGLVLHPTDFRLCWMPDPWSDMAHAAQWLRRLARATRPDLVHLNDFGHASMSWEQPVLLVGHSCVLSWWQAVRGESPPRKWGRYRRLVRAGLERADLVAAPTRAMGDALRRHYGLVAEPRIIPNALAFPVDSRPRTKRPIILAAGRVWDEAKNITALAEIAGELPWQVVVAGESFGAEAPPDITLTGYLEAPALRRHYEEASIFVSPARYEPFGLAALEAAAHGCALVLGDIPSLREVWGGAALFVSPNDHQQLRAVLSTLIADPALCRFYGERAAARAGRYDLKRQTDSYLDVYRELLDSAQTRPTRGSAAWSAPARVSNNAARL